jgi:hypothetical protein
MITIRATFVFYMFMCCKSLADLPHFAFGPGMCATLPHDIKVSTHFQHSCIFSSEDDGPFDASLFDTDSTNGRMSQHNWTG